MDFVSAIDRSNHLSIAQARRFFGVSYYHIGGTIRYSYEDQVLRWPKEIPQEDFYFRATMAQRKVDRWHQQLVLFPLP
jgi:hypothetical protein